MASVIESRPTFDLTGLDFVSVGLVPMDELPEFTPSIEDQAWALGYELEQRGERAKLSDRDCYTPAQHLAFANGQRQARADMAPDKAPGVPQERPTPEELSSMLRVAAGYCEGQGGVLGEFLSGLIRQAAKDVEYYRASNWQEFSAREAEMIESLQRCMTCERQAYLDRQ